MTTTAQHPPQSPATPAAPTVPVLKDLVWNSFAKLLNVKRRLFVLAAFADELDRVRRGKAFRFRNEIPWCAMLDVRDKLVIDFCSFTVEIRHGMKPVEKSAQDEYRGHFKRKRGLFVEIHDHHLSSITRSYVPQPDDDEIEVESGTEDKADAFARLFPGCTTKSPSAADVVALCETFRLKMKPLKDDRNQNRAHPYEQTPDTGTMLWVPQLSALFDYTEELLLDFSTLCGGGSFSSQDMNNGDPAETAADMVDLILLGNGSDVRRLTANRTRDELYARLHAIDDNADDEDDDLYFNDRAFGPPFEDWVI